MRHILVTGASRGLGLEFTRQLLARGDRVLAACRRPVQAVELIALAEAHHGRLLVRTVEMTDPDSVDSLVQEAERLFARLDLLINNAGMNVPGERFGSVTGSALNLCLRTNTVGPFLLAQKLAPLLAKGDAPVVANISSQLGSIARTNSFYTPSYAISKAGLNMATVLLAHAMKPDGVCVVAFHPGWVRTDMGGASAPLDAENSISGLLRIIESLKLEDSGKFVDHQGCSMPW